MNEGQTRDGKGAQDIKSSRDMGDIESSKVSSWSDADGSESPRVAVADLQLQFNRSWGQRFPLMVVLRFLLQL